MRLVSPFLKHAVYPTLYHSGLLDRGMPPGGIAVVNYHGVIPADHSERDIFLDDNLVQAEMFRRQLQFLKAHYRVIHPENYCSLIEQGKPLPPRSVLVTCDDGLVNTLTDMLPLLLAENVPCLFFVTTASCGKNPGMLWYDELYHLMRSGLHHDLNLPLLPEEGRRHHRQENLQTLWWNTVTRVSGLDPKERTEWMDLVRVRHASNAAFHSERRWRLLNIDELKQLVRAGMSVGAHTLNHPVLSLCSKEEAERQIRESKRELEVALGQPVWAFAYPFGNRATVGERELSLARESGYTCAFLNVEHWGNGRPDPFAVPRIHVSRDTSLPEFAAHLSGLHTRLQRLINT